MNATHQTGQPLPASRAHDLMTDALFAIERLDFKTALTKMRDARIVVETEIQFRDARRGAA